jgi:hypothetical protein
MYTLVHSPFIFLTVSSIFSHLSTSVGPWRSDNLNSVSSTTLTRDKAALYSRVSVAAIHMVNFTDGEINIRRCTGLMILRPVPIPKEVVKRIVVVTIVLLLRTACRLILLRPPGFDHLPICLTRILNILERPQHLTKEKVPLDMCTWDSSPDS